jgi:hypothetical protein
MQNVLQLEETKTIWSPYMSFTNALGPFHTILDEFTVGRVIQNSTPTSKGLDQHLEGQVYNGYDSSIIFTKEYFFDFDCNFDLRSYPFDTQVINNN